MNQNNQQPQPFDIKDIFFVMLKKIVIIVLVGILFAACICGYKIFANKNNTSSIDEKVLDISERLPGESDLEYSDRVLDVNHAVDLINAIDTLNNQIDNLRTYVSDSVLMKINSENEAVTSVNIVVSVDEPQTNGGDVALLSLYKQFILSGEYLTYISDEYGVNQGYITELVKADYSLPTVVNENSIDSKAVGIINVSVIGPDTEITNTIMDCILENVDNKCFELNNSTLSHRVASVSRQTSYVVDSTTRDKQYTLNNRFEILQQQIAGFDKSLDTIATKLGVDKSNLYSYFTYNDYIIDNHTVSIGSYIKYIAAGFVVGAAIVMFIILLNYLYSNKFSTQSQFFCRYNSLDKIGVLKPNTKRTKLSKYIDVLSGDDNTLSNDNFNKLLAANIKNITGGLNKVLVTGTVDNTVIVELVNKLGIEVDIKNSIFVDPTLLEIINNYDGIIIVEQRKSSRYNMVDEEIRLLSNAHSKLLGAIVI